MPDEVPGLWTYTAVVWRSCGKHPVAFCIISVYLISFLPSRFCRCHRRERLKPDTPVRLGDQLGIFKGMMSNEAGCSLDIQPLQVSNKTPLLVWKNCPAPPEGAGISGHCEVFHSLVKSVFTLCLAVESCTKGHFDYAKGIFSCLVCSGPCFSQQVMIGPSLMMNTPACTVRSARSKYFPVRLFSGVQSGAESDTPVSTKAADQPSSRCHPPPLDISEARGHSDVPNSLLCQFNVFFPPRL